MNKQTEYGKALASVELLEIYDFESPTIDRMIEIIKDYIINNPPGEENVCLKLAERRKKARRAPVPAPVATPPPEESDEELDDEESDDQVELDDPKAVAILSAAQSQKAPEKPISPEEQEKFAELKKLARQTNANTIPLVIKLARRQELSQAALERCMGISGGSICHANNGRLYPYIRQAFAQHFGIQMESGE